MPSKMNQQRKGACGHRHAQSGKPRAITLECAHGTYHMDTYRHMTTVALADKRQGEVCMCYVRQLDDTSWYSQEQIKQQSKQFRQQRKSGKLTLREDNNGTMELGKKTFYYFVVQHTKPECDMCDPMALANGLIVSGFVYYFTNQYNRDVLYKYIMGIK